MQTSNELDENMAFNTMIWALALIGTGNTKYQNQFYAKQADKITARYEEILGRG